MRPAGVLRAALALAAGGLFSRAWGAPHTFVRFYGQEYVSAVDASSELRLGLDWRNDGNEVVLADHSHRMELSIGTRDSLVDGLRVWLGDTPIGRGGQLYLSRIDFERRLESMVHPNWGPAPPPRPRLIVLDPGHGGRDTGAVNHDLGYMEKTFTLDTALRLRRLLQQAGYAVAMTRTDDRTVDLPQRPEFANLQHADLYLSIHFNAGDTRASGVEVYTFPPQHQHSTGWWQRHDNETAEMDVAWPINGNDWWNTVFAHAMHRELLETLKIPDRGEKLEHLATLKTLECPGILVESAFIVNDAEARKIADPEFRQRIAMGMLAGINAYAAELDALRRPSGAPATPQAR